MQKGRQASQSHAQRIQAADDKAERERHAKLQLEETRRREQREREERRRQDLLDQAAQIARREVERKSALDLSRTTALEKRKAPSRSPEPKKRKPSTSAPKSKPAARVASAASSRSASPKLTVVESHASTVASTSSSAPLTARARLMASFDPGAIVKLNTNPRDLRSVDEIERDMLAKRRGTAVKATSEDTAASYFHQRPAIAKSVSPLPTTVPLPKVARKASPAVASSSSGATPRPAKRALEAPTTQPAKRPRVASAPPIARSPAAKPRPRQASPPSHLSSARDEIWRVMGVDRARATAREYESSDEADDGPVDTSYAALEREERMAERAAARDDKREAETLARAKEAKERRKAERAKRA